jgi:hypothetical protein
MRQLIFETCLSASNQPAGGLAYQQQTCTDQILKTNTQISVKVAATT